MTDSNSSKISVPSVNRERSRMQREASVCIKKIKDIRLNLDELYRVVENYDACRETISAIAKYHKDYFTQLNQYVSIHEKFVRKLSLEEWESLRIDSILAANYALISESSSDAE